VKDRPGSNAGVDGAARFRAAIVARIGENRYLLWFEQHTSFILAGKELIIAVPSEQFQEWMNQAFGDTIRSAAEEVLGGKPTLKYIVDPLLFESKKPADKSEAAQPEPKKPNATKPPEVRTNKTLFGDEVAPPDPPKENSRKSKKHTEPEIVPAAPSRGRRWRSLADFVVGASNRVAHASALSAVEEPGEMANPLVIHGPVGTGKTHLLEGIYQGLRKSQPDSRPCFITAEEFTTRFVQASRYEKHSQFRRQFRECSALLLDDLHFFATKPATQKEFIHTIDALVSEGRQVVVTTDCHPRLADDLMPELLDRLLAGAVWPLQPPDDLTRLEILKKKAATSQPQFPEPVLKMIAQNLRGNVRELEGAVNSIRHYAKVLGKPIDVPLAREALGDLLRHSVRAVSLADVDRAVCTALRLNSGVLQSKARSWSVSHPRMIATYLCRKHTAATYGEISKHFGAKTHSTAVAAEKKVRAWIQKKEQLAIGDREWSILDLIERIERELMK